MDPMVSAPPHSQVEVGELQVALWKGMAKGALQTKLCEVSLYSPLPQGLPDAPLGEAMQMCISTVLPCPGWCQYLHSLALQLASMGCWAPLSSCWDGRCGASDAVLEFLKLHWGATR